MGLDPPVRTADATVPEWVTVAPGERITQHLRDFGSHYGRRFTFIRE